MLHHRKQEGAEADSNAPQEADDLVLHSQTSDVKGKGLSGVVDFWNGLEAACQSLGHEWATVADRIWTFGPASSCGCLLVDSRKDVQASTS